MTSKVVENERAYQYDILPCLYILNKSFLFIPLVLSCSQRDVTVLGIHGRRWHGVFLEVAFSQHEVRVSDSVFHWVFFIFYKNCVFP